MLIQHIWLRSGINGRLFGTNKWTCTLPKTGNILNNYWFLRKNSATWSEWVSEWMCAWNVLFSNLFVTRYVNFTDDGTQTQSDSIASTQHHIYWLWYINAIWQYRTHSASRLRDLFYLSQLHQLPAWNKHTLILSLHPSLCKCIIHLVNINGT